MRDATIHLEAHKSDQCTVCTSTLNFQCAVIHFLMLNQNQCHDFVLLVETNFITASCLGLHMTSYAISLKLITSLEVYKFYNACLEINKGADMNVPSAYYLFCARTVWHCFSTLTSIRLNRCTKNSKTNLQSLPKVLGTPIEQ